MAERARSGGGGRALLGAWQAAHRISSRVASRTAAAATHTGASGSSTPNKPKWPTSRSLLSRPFRDAAAARAAKGLGAGAEDMSAAETGRQKPGHLDDVIDDAGGGAAPSAVETTMGLRRVLWLSEGVAATPRHQVMSLEKAIDETSGSLVSY